MKFIWEESDIKVGRRVWSHNMSESFIIGFDPSFHTQEYPSLLIVSLIDGMVVRSRLNHAEIASVLNEGSYRPDKVEHDQ